MRPWARHFRTHSRRLRVGTGVAALGSVTALSLTLSPLNVMAEPKPSTKKSRSTVLHRYDSIKEDYRMSVDHLRRIQFAFVEEMAIGLEEPDHLSIAEKQSSLKMLSSRVRRIPDGSEKGVFYTLDWGGSNYRVLRIEFRGRGRRPLTSERKVVIREQFKTAEHAEELFDYLASYVLQEMAENDEIHRDRDYPVGFTFSFPMHQPALDQGVLLMWTKGFDIKGVIGHDVAKLMHEAFARMNINARVHAMCNDTVGTLLACAYDYDNVRVGLILGTGSNAAYFDPERGEIINIEWGNFNKLLPRMAATDIAMDDYTPDPNQQYAEKMMSGYYLGELVRLLAIDVFADRITERDSAMNQRWAFKSETVSAILREYYSGDVEGVLEVLHDSCGLEDFGKHDAVIFAKICQLITNRSADLAAALLLGTLQKTGLFQWDPDVGIFELNEEYQANKGANVTIGIDGSVFKYVPRYKERMEEAMAKMVGHGIARRVDLVHSADGSGKGAALAVASLVKE